MRARNRRSLTVLMTALAVAVALLAAGATPRAAAATGRALASVHANWRLTPGSVTKLYATAASLADGRAGSA
jgi:hypothetical protein